MRFIVQLAIETEKASDIDLKGIESSTGGEIVSVTPQPQQARAQTMITGSRGQGDSIPSHMQISPTPTTTVSKTING